ncbi:hypothetical protein [Streptomyces sp. Wb2n-11]|uniref:hypothetical protein n=1 Tax=Streptomyces sp. Wb2n-11 TaxID=1030533 RepID=UPI000A597B16|nr:hypothetical protein [Streptomyces sp. Wb2n-11]
MPNYHPTAGDRVRVTRTRPNGSTHFIKTGTILSTDRPDIFGYHFQDDTGPRVHMATGAQLAQSMRGWTQVIRPL